MSQSLRISGFGPTYTCIFRTKRTCMNIGFSALSMEEGRKRSSISVSNNRNLNPRPNPRPLFATFDDYWESYDDSDDEEEVDTKGKKGGGFFQSIVNALFPWFTSKPEDVTTKTTFEGGIEGVKPSLKAAHTVTVTPSKKPPTPFKLSKDLVKLLMTSKSFEDMEECLRMTWGSIQGMKKESKTRIGSGSTEMKKKIETKYLTGMEILMIKRSTVLITTGSEALDELIGGGIKTRIITEVSGVSRSGKTHLAHTLCVTAQMLPADNGERAKVVFLDTRETFDPELIEAIAERFGMDAGAVLENIICTSIVDYHQMYNNLRGLAARMSKEPIRLLIVDSIIGPFQFNYSGPEEIGGRERKLFQILSRLKKIALQSNVAVFITSPREGDQEILAGGQIRLMLFTGEGGKRVCRIYHAARLPEGAEATFEITPGGIADAKE